ncbi:MAG TPA: hypothetical protein VGS22_16775 [Thermoanaerobaculia bacterium]|jgi:hypothetical protein|nr:hypothetical protein [Thermoanaerobaculia bacterium]
MNSRYLLALAAAAAAAWAFRRWRQAIPVVMVLLVLEGAIRKWVFPGAQDIVYFGKDLLLLGAYAGYFTDNVAGRLRAPKVPVLTISLAICALFGLLQIFNPRSPNLLVGIFGWKAYFFYVPLFFVVPTALSSDVQIVRFLRRYVLLAIPVCLLGMAQFVAPGSSFLNTYARQPEEGQIASFGSSEHIRITGTFAYITGFTSYLMATLILLLALLAASRWRFRGNFWIFSAFGLALVGVLMSGSRGPVLILALLLPLYWWLAVIREGGAATTSRLVIAAALVGSLVVYAGSSATEAWLGRAAGHSDVAERLTQPLLSPVRALEAAGLFGFGIGTAHQTAMALTPGVRPYSWLHGAIVEDEPGKIMIELGPIGFVLFYFIRVFLAFYAFRQVLELRIQFHRAIACACLLFFLAELPGGVVFEVTAGLYFWFFAGLLAAVVALDRKAVQAALAAQPRPVTLASAVRARTRRPGAPKLPPPASTAPSATG